VACFVSEPGNHLLIGRQFWGEELDRNITVQMGVSAPVYDTHSAATQLADYCKAPDLIL
jgi:hypothetical protein